MSWLVLCQILLDKFILRGVGARSAPTPLKINLSRFDIKVARIDLVLTEHYLLPNILENLGLEALKIVKFFLEDQPYKWQIIH
jgi:hypothetical protein